MAFNKFRFVHRGRAASVSSVAYDTSIGNGVDSLGFADLPLRSGATRYFVGSGGSDSNTGLNHAQRFASYGKGLSMVAANSGDQVLLAEGSIFDEDWGTSGPNGAYPSPGGGQYISNKSGFSRLYPTVVQSYDPNDSLNEAKYGRAYQRSAWPKFTAVQTQNSNGTWANFVVRGLEFNPGANDGQFFGFFGEPSGILMEGCKVAYTQLGYQTQEDPAGGLGPTCTDWITRNCVIYGAYDMIGNGRVGGLFLQGGTGTVEDCVFWHNGWPIGGSRDSNGSGQQQAHPIYAQTNTNFVVRRNLFAEPSSDGGIGRGDILWTDNVTLRAPAGTGLGPDGSHFLDNAVGPHLEASYNLTMDGVPFNSLNGGALGLGYTSSRGLPGSRIHHNLIVHNLPQSPTSSISVFSNIAAGADYSYMEHENNLAYLWSPSGYTYYTDAGANSAYSLPFTTYDYNAWDDPASGTNVASSGLTFANAYTPDQAYGAMGYADFDALIAAAVAHPELHIQRNLREIVFAGYNRPASSADHDTVAPILTSPTVSVSGGTVNIGITTNEGNGRIFSIATTSATPPHVSQIKMGRAATNAAATKVGTTISVNSTGVKSSSFTTPSTGTYWVHFMHEDAEGNKSAAVTSASFTV